MPQYSLDNLTRKDYKYYLNDELVETVEDIYKKINNESIISKVQIYCTLPNCNCISYKYQLCKDKKGNSFKFDIRNIESIYYSYDINNLDLDE